MTCIVAIEIPDIVSVAIEIPDIVSVAIEIPDIVSVAIEIPDIVSVARRLVTFNSISSISEISFTVHWLSFTWYESSCIFP